MIPTEDVDDQKKAREITATWEAGSGRLRLEAILAAALAEEREKARLAAVVVARKRLDEEELRAVAQLRASGVSWREIGATLGVTAQAAQQRLGSRTPPR